MYFRMHTDRRHVKVTQFTHSASAAISDRPTAGVHRLLCSTVHLGNNVHCARRSVLHVWAPDLCITPTAFGKGYSTMWAPDLCITPTAFGKGYSTIVCSSWWVTGGMVTYHHVFANCTWHHASVFICSWGSVSGMWYITVNSMWHVTVTGMWWHVGKMLSRTDWWHDTITGSSWFNHMWCYLIHLCS